MKLSILVM